jgi:hypothetical protein
MTSLRNNWISRIQSNTRKVFLTPQQLFRTNTFVPYYKPSFCNFSHIRVLGTLTLTLFPTLTRLLGEIIWVPPLYVEHISKMVGSTWTSPDKVSVPSTPHLIEKKYIVCLMRLIYIDLFNSNFSSPKIFSSIN